MKKQSRPRLGGRVGLPLTGRCRRCEAAALKPLAAARHIAALLITSVLTGFRLNHTIAALDCVIEAVWSMHWSVPGKGLRNSRAALYAAFALRPRSIALRIMCTFCATSLAHMLAAGAGGMSGRTLMTIF